LTGHKSIEREKREEEGWKRKGKEKEGEGVEEPQESHI
jgi:hypothetical protein